MSDVLDRKLEMMHKSAPINVADVDFDFVNPPEILAARMGNPWNYDYIVEQRTGGPAGFVALINTLVPSSREAGNPLADYLPAWLRHEDAHAEVAEQAQRRVGLEPFTDFPSELPTIVPIIGELNRQLPWLEAVGEGIVATQATRNEKLTMDHYAVETEILENLGELEFAQTVREMRRQEALHLGWNIVRFKEILDTLSTTQKRIVAAADRRLWEPVGAKTKQFRPHLVRAIGDLVRDDTQQHEVLDTATGLKIAEGVQRVVDTILDGHLPRRRRDAFVAKRILKYMQEAERAVEA